MPKPIKQSPIKKKTAPRSVVDRIGPVRVHDEGIKINLYGRSGTGKTTLWSSFPGDILAIVCSGRGELLSLSPESMKKVETVELTKSEEVRDLAEYLKTDGEKYNTVVLDHMTMFQDLILKEILGLDEIPEQKSWGLATQQEYGQCAIQFKENIRMLLNLRQNVVLVAQEREFNTDDSKEILAPYVASALSPSIVGWVNPAVDYICQTFIQQETVIKKKKVGEKTITIREKGTGVQYCLRTAPNPVFTTKFRLPKGRELPDYIVDPSYQKLIKLIKGE